MNYLAIKHGKREKRKAHAAGDDLVRNALKFTGSPDLPANLSPRREIELLTKYADDLKNARNDLLDRFGYDALDAAGLMDVEIRRCIRRIARITEGVLKPKGI